MPRAAKPAAKSARTARTPQLTRAQAAKFLSKTPEENVFWCNNGTVIRDMKELKDALAAMTDQTFSYHSNAIKKDFSNWIKYVIGDVQLATDLENATNRQKALQVVEERYNQLLHLAEAA